MLTFYLWAIPIGQLAFAGNYHWFATMLLSLSSLAVMFTKWVIWVTYTVLTVLYITDMHSLSLIRVYSIAISNKQSAEFCQPASLGPNTSVITITFTEVWVESRLIFILQIKIREDEL